MNKKNMLLFSLLCAASFDISSATKSNNETGNYSIGNVKTNLDKFGVKPVSLGNVKKNLDKLGLETTEQYRNRIRNRDRIQNESFEQNRQAIDQFDKISTKHKIRRENQN